MKKKLLILLISITALTLLVGCGQNHKNEYNPKTINSENSNKEQNNEKISNTNKKVSNDIKNSSANNTSNQISNSKTKKTETKTNINTNTNTNTKTKPKVNKNTNYKHKYDMKNREWFFVPNKDHKTPEEPSDVLRIIKDKDAYFVGDTSKKVIYLTFDEGYENGYTERILNILKKHNIKACFFVTEPYIKENVSLLKRMVNEGHIVGNHSKSHVGMDKLVTKDINKFNNELLSPARLFKEKTGVEMGKFFRPPMGAYNELSLYKTQQLGFKTIFWSMAYGDYEPDKQPTKSYAKNLILSRTHPGSIMLLHAVSKTNTEILDDLIKEWKKQGYEFKTLKDLD